MSKASKIQIRAEVLQAVLKFKNSTLPSDFEVESCIKFLQQIHENEFVASLLLKEISGNGCLYDNILTLLLYSICSPDILGQLIFKFLNDNNTSDTKKLFLINVLREQGQSIDYNFIQSHIQNPDEVIDNETKKFLHDAQFSPEVQIDFFDFYFTVNEQDRAMLVDSIINDYSGDELANILEPFAYFYPENHIDIKILEALANSKSYLALKPLKWCAQNNPDDTLSKLADKLYKKLLLSGFDNKKTSEEIYSSFLKGSTPFGFWYSCADGNSNISCVFARKKDNGFIQTFFTVFNLFCGPIASFGFNEVSTKDFNIILLRFFKSSIHAKIPLQEGKNIFDALTKRGWKNDVNVPYEFVCWQRLTYDVNRMPCSFDELLTEKLKIAPTSKKMLFEIFNSDIFSNWFYNCDDYTELSNAVKSILQCKILDIDKLNAIAVNCLESFLSNVKYKDRLIEQIKFQSYILFGANMKSTAKSLYSIIYDNFLFEFFILLLIQKSIYIHFINVIQNQTNKVTTIFNKKNHDEIDYIFISEVIKLIEDSWVLKEE